MILKLAAYFARQSLTSVHSSASRLLSCSHVTTNLIVSRCSLLPVTCYSYLTARPDSCRSSIPELHCSHFPTSVKHYSQMNCNLENKEFVIFYRFTYIRLARFLSRLKIYQTGITVIAVPPAIYFYSAGLIGIESCIGATSLSTVALILLYFIGNFFRRVVGLVSLSTDEQIVRISRLTFWGNRRDIYVSPDDVVPLGEFEDNFGDAYVKLRLYSKPDVYYVFLRYGTIVDKVKFTKIFGSH